MIIAIIFSILVIGSLLTAGCGGWNGGKIQRDQDLRITKLDRDGVMEWTTLIDTGDYDFGLGFTQTPDGGFVVIGGTTKLACQNFPQAPDIPRLTRLSVTGETLWTRDYPVHIVEVIPDKIGRITALVNDGKLLQLDSDGTTLSIYTPKIRQDLKGEWEHFHTFTVLKDGGYILAGQTFVKTDSEGNLLWQLPNNMTFIRAFSIAELENNQGVLILADGDSAEILRLNPDGNITQKIPVINFEFLPKPSFRQIPQGYSIILRNSPSEVYFFDQRGNLTDHVIFKNASWVIPSNDGSFVSIGKSESGDLINKITLNQEGIVTGEKTSKCSAKGCPTLYGDIIQTSDGGYAIMSLIQKEKKC